MGMRILLTLGVIFAWSLVSGVYNPVSTIILGNVAGTQMQNSDQAAVISSAVFSWFNGTGVAGVLAAFALIYLIWATEIKKYWKSMMVPLVAMMFVTTMFSDSKAYVDTVDKTEAYTILPNESAFWVPDIGANKDSQAKFDSLQYLEEKKIAAKRFVVPHQKLGNSGGFLGWDYYIPTGRLFIVDRTPFSREWTKDHHRGTSHADESFPCQTKEGLNITAEVSIGASVKEENASLFLYNFGVVSPPGNRNDPVVIFQSVYYGRSLSNVMDDVGRKKVQTLVCNEIGIRTFDQSNNEMIPIMTNVEKAATTYFAGVGITLNFIGWGGTFTFDGEVQQAVNRRYVALKDAEISQIMASYTTVMQDLAKAQALRSFGEKTDGHLPQTMVGSGQDVGGLMYRFFGVEPPMSSAPKAAPKQ